VVFVVLVMPLAFLGVLFTMDVVEHWVVREPPERPARPEIRSLVPEHRRAAGSNDPPIMVSQGPLRQSL
jgi:hypothetical protein